MIRTYLIPLLAIAGMIFAVYTVISGSKPPPPRAPVVEPARAPFPAFVAGAGLIEPSSENIAVGTPVAGVVTSVDVTVGSRVTKGDVLFRIESRDLEAQLRIREAAVAVAQSNLALLEAGTRPELLPPAQARLAEAQALLADAEDRVSTFERVIDQRAVSAEELARRRFSVATARTRVEQAAADLALLQAGTWAPTLDIARRQLDEARTQADQIRTELERRIVRAPIDGTVLRSNLRAGEFAPAGQLAQALMIVGNVNPLHVRVDIDEHEAWRVRAGSPAVAFVRGNKDISTPLEFVRFEPLIIPKRSLTGESTERVDTRVLQAIYRFDPRDLPIFVGQQMDVFIEAAPVRDTAPASPINRPQESGT